MNQRHFQKVATTSWKQKHMRPSNYIYCTVNSLKIWSAICFKIMTRYTCGFFPTYTCNHSCYTIYVRFFATYTCVLSCFVGTNAHIYMRSKKPLYMRYKQACGIWGHGKSSYKRHQIYIIRRKPLHVRWSWKVTSVWINHGYNGRVNFEQGLVLIHCPYSSGGCWLLDNGFVGIRGLSLQRLCTLFHECWPINSVRN